MRMCCSCRERKPMVALIRLQVVDNIVVPQKTKLPGRSAWVCSSAECVQDVINKPKKLHRSLRTTYSVAGLYTAMEQWLTSTIVVLLRQLYRDGALRFHTSQQIDSTVALTLNRDIACTSNILTEILTETTFIAPVSLESSIQMSSSKNTTVFLTIARHKQKRTVERWALLLSHLKLIQLRN